jgi:hypothetical protein
VKRDLCLANHHATELDVDLFIALCPPSFGLMALQHARSTTLLFSQWRIRANSRRGIRVSSRARICSAWALCPRILLNVQVWLTLGVLHAIAPAAALATVVALRVHLDDSTHANGPLRVLPGTHVGGVLTHDDIHRLTGVVPSVECVSSAGAVVAMRPLVVHASSKASDDQPRRVLHIEYAATIRLGAGIELVVG